MRKEEGNSLFPGCSKNDSVGLACHTSFGNGDLNKFLDETAIPGRLDGSRSPGTPSRALARCVPGEPADPACPLLDTLLTKVSTKKRIFESFRFVRKRTQRILYSRVYWGLQLPGRYYFGTFTNTGFGKVQRRNFKRLVWWLKRYRPGISGCYCFTDEGGGVIHIVIRLGMRSKMMDKKEVDKYLAKIGCGFCLIKPVKMDEKGIRGLADYLADQNRKSRMAREMAYQSRSEKMTSILAWNYFGVWLPRGWTIQLRRAWYYTNGMRLEERLTYFKSWLLEYAKNPSTPIPNCPVTWDTDVGWICMEEEEIKIWSDIERDNF